MRKSSVFSVMSQTGIVCLKGQDKNSQIYVFTVLPQTLRAEYYKICLLRFCCAQHIIQEGLDSRRYEGHNEREYIEINGLSVARISRHQYLQIPFGGPQHY